MEHAQFMLIITVTVIIDVTPQNSSIKILYIMPNLNNKARLKLQINGDLNYDNFKCN